MVGMKLTRSIIVRVLSGLVLRPGNSGFHVNHFLVEFVLGIEVQAFFSVLLLYKSYESESTVSGGLLIDH